MNLQQINHYEFYHEVVTRCQDLIKIHYWDRIDKYTLEQWLNNFSTEEEKYLAAHILYNFQYRNQKAMLSMFKQIVQVYLPQKLEELEIYSIDTIEKWESILSSDKAFKLPFRFSTINKSGCIGESGDALFRLYAQHNIIYKGIGRFIQNIDPQIKTVILVDDITGSGNQFKKFYFQFESEFKTFDHILYVPLVAHPDAIKNIQKISQKIHIMACEVITDKNTFYNIVDKYNSNQDFLIAYEKMIKKNSLHMKFPFGYNKQAILYAMNISTPNNNLACIYHNKKWYPLLRR